MSGRKRQREDGNPATTTKKPRKYEAASSVTTRGTKRRNLSDAVFLTTELLENILEYLPMKDLLISQRVARKWRAVINENKKLQQNLFMIPREAETGWEMVLQDDEGEEGKFTITAINPITITDDHLARENVDLTLIRHTELNPLLFEIDVQARNIYNLFVEGGCPKFSFKKKFQGRNSQRTWAKHPEASWRKMLVRQPPTRSINYGIDYHQPSEDHQAPHCVEDEGPLTVGGLLAKVKDVKKVNADAFTSGEYFMSIKEKRMVCPMEGDQELARVFLIMERAFKQWEREGTPDGW